MNSAVAQLQLCRGLHNCGIPVGLPSDMTSVLDGRAWRTTKVGEFGVGRIPALCRDPLAVGATA